MDVLAELFTRIRNAGKAQHEKVDIPSSKLKAGVVEVLKSFGFIKDFRVVKVGSKSMMRVYLRYLESGEHAVTQIRRVSRPGLRVYVGSGDIPKVRQGYGVSILSTNQGIISSKDARDKKLGGELLCQVW
ncbi:MAG: 30S ribosomal protein S8 [Pseudomonadota bacterium]|nr:30S ribosomal protein S8 [Pseudomonadota bacterium]